MIQAPVEQVFSVFTDFRKMEERIKGIQRIEFLEGDGEARQGMRWRETRVMFGKEATEEMWIGDIKENESYTVETKINHGTKYQSTYTFARKGDGTEVVLEFTGTPVSFGAKLMSPVAFLFRGAIVKAFRADMDDLRKILEQ